MALNGVQRVAKVSFVVPVYNVAPFVERCVQSLVSQASGDCEVILVNDGSRDNSLAECERMASRYENVRLIDQANQGVSVARNAGMDAATGQWVCFVDGDDWLVEGSIAECLRQDLDDADILLSEYRVATPNNEWDEAFLPASCTELATERDRIELIKNCYVHTPLANAHTITMLGVPWAKLFRREFLVRSGVRFDPSLRKMQDAVFNSYAFYNARIIRHCTICTYVYRQNGGSVTHKANPKYLEVTEAVLRAFDEFIQTYGLQDELAPVYYAKSFMVHFDAIKFMYLLDGKKRSATERRAACKDLMERGAIPREFLGAAQGYLGKAHRVALKLCELRLYGLVYGFADAYMKLKNKQYR